MIIVLGATGYLGSYFVKYLRQEGEDVFGLSRAEIDYTEVTSLISILRSKKSKFLINVDG